MNAALSETDGFKWLTSDSISYKGRGGVPSKELITNKSDVGSVAVGIDAGDIAVRLEMMSAEVAVRAAAAPKGCLVQGMMPCAGYEIIPSSQHRH